MESQRNPNKLPSNAPTCGKVSDVYCTPRALSPGKVSLDVSGSRWKALAGWHPSPASPRTPPITTTYRRRQAEAARRGLALSDCSDSPEQEELGAVFDADPEQDLSADAYQELLDACDQAQHAYALTLCETPSRSDADSLALVPTPQEEPSQRQSTATRPATPPSASRVSNLYDLALLPPIAILLEVIAVVT